ncbi:MAG: VIT1/CCC1 transporter family protein [Deltaproteobacteria bacterium]|jgi:VIT1/CCC1 family predicted Fe2+/Mn2+ transporter
MAPSEQHRSHLGGWLRAAVLGANDGIVSIASLVLGVAAAEPTPGGVLVAGLAGLVGGALSMAAGEYVSVSSQRDVELADLARERAELASTPEAEHAELVGIYVKKGLSPALAEEVARTLVRAEEPLRVHAREELRLDPDELAAPGQAAVVSALSFALGAALPLAVITTSPLDIRVPLTLASGLAALGALGAWSAKLGGAPLGRAVLRVLGGGALAMGLTYAIGALFGAAP